MFVYRCTYQIEAMNSLTAWLRSFFSWVLLVDTPPYPYESWRDLPEEQWPQRYDPVTNSFPLADTAVRAVDGPQPAEPEKKLTETHRHATDRFRKHTTRELRKRRRFAH